MDNADGGITNLMSLIRDHLSDDLRRAPWKGSPNPMAGHCYVASEALYHFCGGADGPLKPMFINHEGAPHWYLIHQNGRIYDPTFDQFDSIPRYLSGKGKGFLTRQPSKRAQIVMDRVRAEFIAAQTTS